MSEPKWTIGSILTWTKQYFADKGVASPRLDAEVLLSHILGTDRMYLYVNFDQPLEAGELAAFREAVKKRAARMPVAYITGRREFFGLSFAVTPAVLIPRPDTEVLVEAVIRRFQATDGPSVLDIGTGSGAVIVSLLHKLPAARGVATDVSAEALAVAADNAARLGVADRLEFLRGDLLAPAAGRVFDAIVSNPPYIAAKDMAALEPELGYEPRGALAGGADGLDFYRRMAGGAAALLRPGGFLAVEVGAGQARQVAALATEATGLEAADTIKDYAGVERVVVLERRL
ncbi:peptide chain release factor N(5)-glutamine methyltransferase [Anaeroselena agilis]|uniref:Release factor glutamine methyltransferase n=1 Tax=Anaeroselena agilis TaxID=3063788 RepID=A0ABU3P3V4_9FIRM|nr:peptide chain release factor N(5)-glutamine methyltransferase [Selenomonadales bacterium 4137-cl]